MKIEISKKDLMLVLAPAKRILPLERKAPYDIYRVVMFDATNSRIVASSHDETITSTFRAKIEGNGNTTVPIKPALDFIDQFPPETNITITETTIEANSETFNFRPMKALSYVPMHKEITAKGLNVMFRLHGETFTKQIKKMFATMSRERNEFYAYTINGLYFHGKPQAVQVCSTNRHSLTTMPLEMKGVVGKSDVAITLSYDTLKTFVTVMEKNRDDDVELEFSRMEDDEQFFEFVCGGIVIRGRCLKNNFPPYESMIPLKNEATKVVRFSARNLLDVVPKGGQDLALTLEACGMDSDLHVGFKHDGKKVHEVIPCFFSAGGGGLHLNLSSHRMVELAQTFSGKMVIHAVEGKPILITEESALGGLLKDPNQKPAKHIMSERNSGDFETGELMGDDWVDEGS